MNMTIPMLPGECWYGLATIHGTKFPLNETSEYSWHPTQDFTGNQESPILLSSLGRYLWSEFPYDVDVSQGLIRITNAADDLILSAGHGTLCGAFLAASKNHFPANGQIPPENFFLKPQYNTWAELIYDQSQASILRYAHGIIDNHMPPGILMIDDGWMEYYGRWQFNAYTFPDPKAMLDELHTLGFEVMLWVCPFVSPDSPEFRFLSDKGYLVCNADGTVAIRNWWNGYSAVLDLSNPHCAAWFDTVLSSLMEMGVDGFKFDAGDVQFYKDDDKTYGGVSAHNQCQLWTKLGLKYRYNEYRATYKCAGLPLVQRLGDKPHQWSSVAQLIPDALTQGIMGYAYICPDIACLEKAQKNKPQPTTSATPARRKLSYKEQRELEELEKLLPQLENEKSELEEKLSSGTLSHEELSAAAARIGEIINQIEEKEMRWLELSEI